MNSKLFEELKKFIDFPKANILDIKAEKNESKINDDQFFFYLKAFSEINILNKKIDEIKYVFENYFNDISSIIIKIKNNSNFKILEIINIRLEIIVNLLKNPNIINIKRKLIEIIIFHLYSENSEYFEIDNNYIPPFSHLVELEKLIIDKRLQNKNNKDILDDMKKLEKIKLSIKNNEKILNENQPKNNDKKKINHLNKVKGFLEFYLGKLHPYVYISENKGKFYILPRSMLKTETNTREYLFALESLIGSEKNKKKDKNNIIGLDNKIETNKEPIYYEKKLLTIDEEINILFSYNSNIEDLETDIIKQITKKYDEFKNDLNIINKKCKNLFDFDIKQSDKFDDWCDFSENIKNQIKKYVETFEKNVISKLDEALNLLFFELDFKACKNIINELNPFLREFIMKNNFKINNIIYKEFKDKNHVVYYVIIKICIVQKIIDLFLVYKKKIQDYLEIKEKQFLILMKKITLNLKNINNYVLENCKIDNISDIYNKWTQNSSNTKFKINELKSYLKRILIKK